MPGTNKASFAAIIGSVVGFIVIVIVNILIWCVVIKTKTNTQGLQQSQDLTLHPADTERPAGRSAAAIHMANDGLKLDENSYMSYSAEETTSMYMSLRQKEDPDTPLTTNDIDASALQGISPEYESTIQSIASTDDKASEKEEHEYMTHIPNAKINAFQQEDSSVSSF